MGIQKISQEIIFHQILTDLKILTEDHCHITKENQLCFSYLHIGFLDHVINLVLCIIKFMLKMRT